MSGGHSRGGSLNKRPKAMCNWSIFTWFFSLLGLFIRPYILYFSRSLRKTFKCESFQNCEMSCFYFEYNFTSEWDSSVETQQIVSELKQHNTNFTANISHNFYHNPQLLLNLQLSEEVLALPDDSICVCKVVFSCIMYSWVVLSFSKILCMQFITDNFIYTQVAFFLSYITKHMFHMGEQK